MTRPSERDDPAPPRLPPAAPAAADPAPPDATVAPNDRLVQIAFAYRGPGNPSQRLVAVLASLVANAPGLVWKTWLISETRAEAGALYLFRDEMALGAFLRRPALRALREVEGLRELTIKTFETLNEIPLIAIRRWDEAGPDDG